MKIAELLSIKFEFPNFSPTSVDRNNLSDKLEEAKDKLLKIEAIRDGLITNCTHVSYNYQSNNDFIFSFVQDENKTSVVLNKPAYGCTEQSWGKMGKREWELFFLPIEENVKGKIAQIEGILNN